MIRHHLDDESIARLAAGTLEAGWALAAATHVTMCPSCRVRLRAFEGIGGYFLECAVANDNGSDGWQDMEKRISGVHREAKVDGIVSTNRPGTLLPEPLASYVDRAGGLKWRFLGRGAAQMIVPTEDTTTTVRLLRIPAGRPVPEHSHRGIELTLVLDGSFRDEVSTFGRGDVEIADGSLTHTPIAIEGKDCICLAVTDAPLKFTSFLMCLLQRFFRI